MGASCQSRWPQVEECRSSGSLGCLGFANYVGDLAGYWQADLHETTIPIPLIPGGLKYDLSCAMFCDCVHVRLTVFHHMF